MSEKSNVVIEDIGPCRKKLTITVPAEAISEQIGTSFDTLAHGAELPGFRKGRAPRRLLEKRFGESVMTEARGQLVSSAYSQAVQDNSLTVIGDPEGGDDVNDVDLSKGEAFTFAVEVDIAPEFDLPDLEGIKILKPLFEVEDKHVDEQIEKFKINEGSLEEHDKAEAGDYCIGHGKITNADGKEPVDIESAVIQIPDKGVAEGSVLGVKIDDFSKQVGKPKPGDSLTIKAKGPDNHDNEDIRGQDLTITFEVAQVQRILPATTEQLLTKFGMSDEQQFREAVTLRLNQRVLTQQQAALRSQVVKHLLENIDFELPERITAQQAAQNIERQRAEMRYRGADEDEIEKHLVDIRAQSDEAAQRDLKVYFILSAIAQKLEVQINEQDVGARIYQMASERGMRPDAFRDELLKSNGMQIVAQQVREHKAIDQLVEKADLEEVSAEEYAKRVADSK